MGAGHRVLRVVRGGAVRQLNGLDYLLHLLITYHAALQLTTLVTPLAFPGREALRYVRDA